MIVITGVSRGLGSELFDGLHEAGHDILALGRSFTDRQQAFEDGLQVRLRVTDLADPATLPDPAELAELVGEASAVTLLHNAGTIEPFAPIGGIQPEQLLNAVMVNFTAPMLLTNALLAAVAGDRVLTGPGTPLVHVVYVSSSAASHQPTADRPPGGRAAYAATKAGAEMFFKCLAAQHGNDPSVRVSIVDPGIMDTDMQYVMRMHASAGTYFPDKERFLSRYRDGLPSPQDVAGRIIAEHLSSAPVS